MKKNDFRRIITAINHEEPDRLPLAELWVDAEIKAEFLGNVSKDVLDCRKQGYDVEQDIKFWQKAGYDFIRISPRYEFFQTWLKEPERDDFAEKTLDFIKSIDYSDIEKSAKFLPDGMKLMFAPEGGIYEQAWMTIGYEKFMIGLYENPEYIRRVCDSLGSAIFAMFEKVAKYEHIGGFWLSDDIAYTESLIMSPDSIREYLFPWYKKFVKLAKENNKLFFFHSDGNFMPLIDDLIAMKVDAIHPIEPKAWDVAALKEKVKGKLSLLGSVDMDYPLARGTIEEVDEYIKKRIFEVAPGGGFAIGSSNSVAKYIPLTNYKAMLSAVKKYGRYPIK